MHPAARLRHVLRQRWEIYALFGYVIVCLIVLVCVSLCLWEVAIGERKRCVLFIYLLFSNLQFFKNGLYQVPYWDAGWQIPIDSLHQVSLGLARDVCQRRAAQYNKMPAVQRQRIMQRIEVRVLLTYLRFALCDMLSNFLIFRQCRAFPVFVMCRL